MFTVGTFCSTHDTQRAFMATENNNSDEKHKTIDIDCSAVCLWNESPARTAYSNQDSKIPVWYIEKKVSV